MSNNYRDQAESARDSEALDVARLSSYLAEALSLRGELTVAQFKKGFSNLTYLLTMGSRELVLRRPPRGAKIATAHDMKREYTVLAKLIQVFPKVPQPFLYCEDPEVIGAPFYVMERKQGIILRNRPVPGLDLGPATMLRLSEESVDTLAQLHRVDLNQAGLVDLGKPQGYVARQVTGWIKRYEKAKTDEIPAMELTAGWLAENMPSESGVSLIHNDFKYDNLVWDDDLCRVLAILDWEMATIGDPLMDLGTSLAYWAESGDPEPLRMFGLTWLPGNLDREGVVARYVSASGAAVEKPVFYYVFGLFKVAVIGQQIYARYKQGYSKDQRFGQLIHAVKASATLAASAIAKNRLSGLS